MTLTSDDESSSVTSDASSVRTPRRAAPVDGTVRAAAPPAIAESSDSETSDEQNGHGGGARVSRPSAAASTSRASAGSSTTETSSEEDSPRRRPDDDAPEEPDSFIEVVGKADPADQTSGGQLSMLSGKAQHEETRRLANLQAKPLDDGAKRAIAERRAVSVDRRAAAESDAAKRAGAQSELEAKLARRRAAADGEKAEEGLDAAEVATAAVQLSSAGPLGSGPPDSSDTAANHPTSDASSDTSSSRVVVQGDELEVQRHDVSSDGASSDGSSSVSPAKKSPRKHASKNLGTPREPKSESLADVSARGTPRGTPARVSRDSGSAHDQEPASVIRNLSSTMEDAGDRAHTAAESASSQDMDQVSSADASHVERESSRFVFPTSLEKQLSPQMVKEEEEEGQQENKCSTGSPHGDAGKTSEPQHPVLAALPSSGATPHTTGSPIAMAQDELIAETELNRQQDVEAKSVASSQADAAEQRRAAEAEAEAESRATQLREAEELSMKQRQEEEEEEKERIARQREAEERAVRQRELEEERLSRQRAEDDRVARERAEEDRVAQQRAAEDRVARQREAEEKRKQEEELRAREAAFWQAMTPEEAERMRGMLQAMALYQQQLHQNEHVITDLHSQIGARESQHRSFRRRIQQATQETRLAQEQEVQAKEEFERWTRKRHAYEEIGEDVDTLRAHHSAAQAECVRLKEVAAPAQAELKSLRERLSGCEETGRAQAARLAALKARCQQTVATLKAEQTEELTAVRVKQTEDLTRLDVGCQKRLSDLRVQHSEDASKLRCALEEASRRRDKLRLERDEAADELLARQREGTRLQQQCSDARQEALDLSTHVRSFYSSSQGSRSRPVASNSSLANVSFAGEPGDAEVQAMRQHCRALERQCSKTHSALERKQKECERWRSRAFQPSPLAGDCGQGTFTLGPAEGEVSSLAIGRRP